MGLLLDHHVFNYSPFDKLDFLNVKQYFLFSFQMNQIWQKLLYFDGVVSNLPNFRELANEVMSSPRQGRRNV